MTSGSRPDCQLSVEVGPNDTIMGQYAIQQIKEPLYHLPTEIQTGTICEITLSSQQLLHSMCVWVRNFWCAFTVNTEAVSALSYSYNSGQVGYCGYVIIM
jgi:hypothetical protein